MPSNKFVWREGDIEVLDTGDMHMHDEKWRFIHAQILASCRFASFQRSHVYTEEVSNRDRANLHQELDAALQEIGTKYGTSAKEPDHVRNIVDLAARISKACGPALAGGRFRLGIAQKSLNLYLKYLWCLRRIPMPPHCPFDSRIIARIPGSEDVLWTKLDKLADYESLVVAAKRKAGEQSLAEWELREYQLA